MVALGNGVAGEAPPARNDRRILTIGLESRTAFTYEIHGWDGKSASIAGFQIREVGSLQEFGRTTVRPLPIDCPHADTLIVFDPYGATVNPFLLDRRGIRLLA